MDEEKWRPIVGYEGRYEISSHGRVKKVNTGIIMRQREWNGYMHVHLRYRGAKRKFFIHRLVALAFHDNPQNKEYVNHIDRDRKHNNLRNLEWVTPGENSAHWRAHEKASDIAISDMPF